MLDQITPLILTLDEEANIERVLDRLRWAREVVVVDSGSRDATRALLARFANVRCVEHAFLSHASQWNYGLAETGISTDWVLALDADYMIPDELVEELRALVPASHTAGYRIRFRYCVLGTTLRGALYPPAISLYRRAGADYVQDGHTQRLRTTGTIGQLRSAILHDDRKPISRWFAAQARYAKLEGDLLCDKSWHELAWSDRLRQLIVPMPLLAFVYCLTIGRGILDGWPGLYYALQRAVAEAMLSLVLIERKVARMLPGKRGC